MNTTTYLFGNLSTGYTQYPDDHARTVFETFHRHSQSTTQIATHRAGPLMYYGYVRRLDGDRYIGLAAVVNGLMIADVSRLFHIFEGMVEMMVRAGYLLHFSDSGEIVSSVSHLHESREELDILDAALRHAFDALEPSALPLPPESYATDPGSVRTFSLADDAGEIRAATHSAGYTFIYKSAGYETAQTRSYRGIVARKNRENLILAQERDELRREVERLSLAQRNTRWVSALAIIVVVMGMVLWNKVLFPSEVTKKDMGEYVYYGPIINGKPHGTGMAIYKDDDAAGRQYYYGNFTQGKRVDDDAMLFYRDGSYFHGSMDEDNWIRGTVFNVDKKLFEGEFSDNKPYTGTWYVHEKLKDIRDGQDND